MPPKNPSKNAERASAERDAPTRDINGREIAERNDSDRDKALDNAVAQIHRAHGKGSVMRLGERSRAPIDVIPTGSTALDIALGIGGLPRGRVVEIYGPESSGKTTVALHAVANAQKAGGVAAFIDAEHALDPDYARKLGVDTDALLISQPDSGEQALEIADMLIRSGALDIIVIDSVAALVPRAEIDGEMGDSHVGLQARLMSQALRKMTGAINGSGTTAVFINQLREKIGVMFGCLSGDSKVTLADGSSMRIQKIVNQKLDVEVMSYDPELDAVVPRRVTNWFNNGPTTEFLHFRVGRPAGSGARTGFAVTPNHLVRTPGGWREAAELMPGDRVMHAVRHYLSQTQWQVALGGLLGDGALSATSSGLAARYRWGHGSRQDAYSQWKADMFGNLQVSGGRNARGGLSFDLTPLAELAELHKAVYFGDGKKTVSDEYLKALTPMALAVWYMDDGGFTLRSKGLQARTAGGSGRVEICVEAMNEGSRVRLRDYLRDVHGMDVRIRLAGRRKIAVLVFSTASSAKFHELVAPFVHPSMDFKLLPRFRGKFGLEPEFVEPHDALMPSPIFSIEPKALTSSQPRNRYDIEVEGTHNYFADGVMVHNSPETTTGGKALKFYASVRLDVRRIETLKDGTDMVGNRTRIKVVKNKLAPPFKQAEFDIMYGQGISREGSLIDVGVETGFVRKAGAWYTYEGDQLGQGKENARQFLMDNPDLADELEKRIKEHMGVGPQVDQPSEEPVIEPPADIEF